MKSQLPVFIALTFGRIHEVNAALLARFAREEINSRSGNDSRAGDEAAIHNDLPIKPHITPALAVAGAILMFTGIAYLMIGFKNKRLHIFLSVAYLTSLAITILIVHLMSLPISNAVQGAYLVAVTMPALILGATSLLIVDITEGLGCLLGGFCLSMWLLVMKPGGLIDGSAAKIIFISIITAIAYALFFSRLTKEYAAIVLISFSGATVVILGIDCFSRAGLKEFWLYIWALDSNLFPTIMGPYPITRGMKAEIALIFIAFIGGVISQSRVRKVISERRKEQASNLLENERQHQKHEEELGRKLEEGIHKERVLWETVHGDGRIARALASTAEEEASGGPSNIGLSSVHTSNPEASLESIEMEVMSSPRRGACGSDSEEPAESTQKVMTIHRSTGQDHKSQQQLQGAESDVEIPLKQHSSSSPSVCANRTPIRKPVSSSPICEADVKPKEAKLSGSTISTSPTARGMDSATLRDPKRAEHQNNIVSELGLESTNSIRRLSRKFIPNSLSGTSNKVGLESEEAFLLAKVDVSRTSSLAVTVDPYYDDGGIHLQEVDEIEPEKMVEYTELGDVEQEPAAGIEFKRLNTNQRCMLTSFGAKTPIACQMPPLHIEVGAQPHQVPIRDRSLSSTDGSEIDKDGTPNRRIDHSDIDSNQPSVASPIAPLAKSMLKAHSARMKTEVLTANTVAQLSSQPSKNITAYRTDEWAKQVSTAEEQFTHPADRVPSPDDDRMKLNETYTVADMSNESDVAKMGIDAPSAVPEVIQPLGRITREVAERSQSASKDAMTPIWDSEQLPIQASLLTTSPARSHRIPSGLSPSFQASANQSIHRQPLHMLDQPLVDSPNDDESDTIYPSQSASVRKMLHTKLLPFSQHQTRVRNMTWSASQSSAWPWTIPSDAAYHQHSRMHPQEQNDDKVSLSERRYMIQHQRRVVSHDIPRLSLNNPFFDSHQPRRSSKPCRPHQREAMLTAWRDSLKWDRAASQDLETAVEGRRVDLFLEQRQERQQQTAIARHKEGVMAQALQNGELEELHRQAMRKMQAQAKTQF